MAKCQNCGRGTTFGNNRPWSKKATRRTWRVNVQKINVMEGGKLVSKRYCTQCIRLIEKV